MSWVSIPPQHPCSTTNLESCLSKLDVSLVGSHLQRCQQKALLHLPRPGDGLPLPRHLLHHLQTAAQHKTSGRIACLPACLPAVVGNFCLPAASDCLPAHCQQMRASLSGHKMRASNHA
jgi:hypothetical protein